MAISTTGDLVHRLFAGYRGDLASVVDQVWTHNHTSRARHGLSGGSTGKPDCAFLHLLVHAFERRHIFEIGTYVGSSAVAMALAAQPYGGDVITTDPHDYGCIPEPLPIRFMQGTALEALRVLKTQGARIDFVFADWAPCPETVDLLSALGTSDMIFTAHDYAPGDKGELAVRLVSERYARVRDGTWFFPEAKPIEAAPSLMVEQATAVLLPNSLLARLG